MDEILVQDFNCEEKMIDCFFCDEECDENSSSRVAYQDADINLPIEIKPDITVGDIKAKCFGPTHITCIERECEKSCKIVASQKVCIKIPITYEIITTVGEGEIYCD